MVDGKTLVHILASEELTRKLAELGEKCSSVVVCRASPSQKALVVRMMMNHELRKAGGDLGGIRGWINR